MKSLKFFAFILVGLALTTTSCKKTDDNNNNNNNDPVKKTCYINKIDNGSDYSLLTYNSDHQVTKVVNYDSLGNPDGSRTDFFYSNGKIEKMENWDSGVLDSRIIYHYGTSGKPDSAYVWADQGSGFAKVGVYITTFTGDNLTKVELSVEYNGVNLILNKTEYTYNGNNVATTSVYNYDFTTFNMELSETRSYEYDSKKNPYRGIGLDNFFVADDVMFFSDNNATKETIKDETGAVQQNESVNNTYEYNDDDYPTKVTSITFDGSDTETTILTYDCE